jgi:hypothetical protein
MSGSSARSVFNPQTVLSEISHLQEGVGINTNSNKGLQQDLSDISGQVQQNASDISGISKFLENNMINGKFYCYLGVKLPKSDSRKSYTVTLEIEVGLASYILYQTYTDENKDEIKDESIILPVFDNFGLKNTNNNFYMPLSQLFNSGIYFSEELKNELQYLCRYNDNCLEFTRESVNNFTPLINW